MNKLTHTEAFVLDLAKHEPSIDFSSFLKIYAYAFLDKFASLSNLDPVEFCIQEKPLIEALTSLEHSKFVTKQSRHIFNALSLINFKAEKGGPEIIEKERPTIIEDFNKALSEFIHKLEQKGTKFELRYFWPQGSVPQVVDFGTGLFDPESYTYKDNEDLYWINESGINIKVRNNELHIKECLQNIAGIGHFSKKKKLLLETSPFDLQRFETMTVRKKRFIRKFGDKTKIELSQIWVKGQEWSTVCVESKHFQNVLALSLFINPEHAERQTYANFLYGRL